MTKDWKSLEGQKIKIDVGTTKAEALASTEPATIYITTDNYLVMNGEVISETHVKDLGDFEDWSSMIAAAAAADVVKPQYYALRVSQNSGTYTGVILQSFETNICRQTFYWANSVQTRLIYFDSADRGSIVSVGDFTLFGADGLRWEADSRKLLMYQFGSVVGKPSEDTDAIPLATASKDGLMSKAQATFLGKANYYLQIGLTAQKTPYLLFVKADDTEVYCHLPIASAEAYGLMSPTDYTKLAAFGAASTYALAADVDTINDTLVNTVKIGEVGLVQETPSDGSSTIKKLYLMYGTGEVSPIYAEFPTAVESESDGLMSAEDKRVLEYVRTHCFGGATVTATSTTCELSFKNNAGTEVRGIAIPAATTTTAGVVKQANAAIGSNYETLSDDDLSTLEETILHLKRLKGVVKPLVDSLNTAGIIKRS